MAINLSNSAANLSGDTVLTAENSDTVTGLKTFSRGASAPFAVVNGSAKVTDLDADTVDGLHAADLGGADPTAIETISAVWTFSANPVFNANAIPETAIADGAVLARLAGTETITGVWTLDSRSKIKAGSAASLKASIGGVIYSQYTAVGNVGAGEDTLYSQSIPASVLATDGDVLVIEAFGRMVADAGTKNLRFKWDGSTFHTLTESTAADNWAAKIIIARRGATSQIIGGSIVSTGSSTASNGIIGTGSATLSGAVTFAITGEGVNNDDVTVEIVRIHWEPVNV